MDGVVSGANDKHLRPWTELLKEHGIAHTPLTPFIDRALLGHNHMYVDGSEIERTGFAYEVPALTGATLRPVVEEYVTLHWFPPVLGEPPAGGGGGGGGGSA